VRRRDLHRRAEALDPGGPVVIARHEHDFDGRVLVPPLLPPRRCDADPGRGVQEVAEHDEPARG